MQAFVEFAKEVYASDALQFHRMNMGSRYVEVFKSNRFEMTQVRAAYTYGPVSSRACPGVAETVLQRERENRERKTKPGSRSLLPYE